MTLYQIMSEINDAVCGFFDSDSTAFIPNLEDLGQGRHKGDQTWLYLLVVVMKR
jgi:hypothetical protein